MFDINSVKELIKGKRVIMVHFNNDPVWFFVSEKDGEFTEDNLVVVNGVECVRKQYNIASQGDEHHRGISNQDIPVWMYKPIETIESIAYLDDEKDLKRIDTHRFYTFGG